jgi:AsmA-like C-terminal region/Protein of unknown function
MNDLPDPPPKAKRPRRRRFGLWMLLSVVLLGALLVLIGLSLSGRRISAPDWVTAQVVKRVNANLPSGRVSLGRLQLQVDKSGVPRILMGNLGIFDDRGTEVARLNEVGARFSLVSLLKGQIKPEVIRLTGAQMTLRRRRDGQFDISFGTGAATTGTLPGVLDAIDAVFAREPLNSVGQLNALELTITLEDARSGRLWQITDGELQVKRAESGLDISINFEVFNGTEELAEVIIGIRTDAANSRASIGTTFKNAAATDIALQSPVLSFLGVLQAPISGAVRTAFDDQGVMQTLAGTLEIGAGALQPTPGIEPVRFASAKSYFEFDPATQRLDFSEVSLSSQTASLVARGQAYLKDYQDGWPSALVGQFTLSDISAFPRDYFDQPVKFSEGVADFRVRLAPFSVDVGQFVLIEGDDKMVAKGRVRAAADGWRVSGDLALNQISNQRLLTLWPVSTVPKTRDWLARNIKSAQLSDVKAAIRIAPDKPVRLSVGWNFKDATVRYMRTQPEIEQAAGYALIDQDMLTLVVDKGVVNAPQGGQIQMGGTSFQIPDLTEFPATAKVRLVGISSTTAVLSLLDTPPFGVLRHSDFTPDVADGTARFKANIQFKLSNQIKMEDVIYSATGTLEDMSSDRLVSGRRVTAKRLSLRADNASVEIAGPIKLGRVAADVVWRQDMGADQVGKSKVTGTVELSQDFVREFGIGLPDDAVQGRGSGQFALSLEAEHAPQFTLSSDLNRVALDISQIGWHKSRNSTGKLTVAGTLGALPKVDLLELTAPGLTATGGQVTLSGDGLMKTASFKRVLVGGWLDAPVTLRGRGSGAVPAVILSGGTVDIRKTAFAGAPSRSTGSGGPITLNLDKVIVSEGMVLTSFTGEFTTKGGFSGRFVARMNGKTQLNGQLTPDANGTAIRIKSTNAGGVMRAAGIVEYANGGDMNLTLRPQPQDGVYLGHLQIDNTKVVNAPGLTELLSAISIVGLLDQMSGEGISFDDVKADFRLSPKAVQLTSSSAVGPSLGVSLDGLYDLTTSTMTMQGVISPVYFLNGIGQLFSKRGEGLFGFTFKLGGTAENPSVSVNPLSILTPGAFREIFRSPPPKPPE